LDIAATDTSGRSMEVVQNKRPFPMTCRRLLSAVFAAESIAGLLSSLWLRAGWGERAEKPFVTGNETRTASKEAAKITFISDCSGSCFYLLLLFSFIY